MNTHGHSLELTAPLTRHIMSFIIRFEKSYVLFMGLIDIAHMVYTTRLVPKGAVTPVGTVVTAIKTGVKKWSTGQGVFLPLVKQLMTIFTSPHSVVTIYRCLYKRTGLGLDWVPGHQNVNNAGYGFWCPAIFWRAYIHFSLVRTADLNSVSRANFARTKPVTGCILLQY